MMYALHVNMAVKTSRFFVYLQLLRLALKLFILPLKTAKLIGTPQSCTILQTVPHLDTPLATKNNVGLVELKFTFGWNHHAVTIFNQWKSASKILLSQKHLYTSHSLALLHRLLDYFLTYNTIQFNHIKTLLLENDRFPTSKALIDKARYLNIRTVKFDYWLLDPIHHNDIYCDTYFCPNDSHKTIAVHAPANKHLTIINGGFPNWDDLNTIRIEQVSDPFIVYFTQPTIPMDEHKRYIDDLACYATHYKLIIKVHPREEISLYAPFATSNIEVIGQEIDSYTLLAQGSMFFSIFSTVSLEAKHLCEYSFFIHYTASAHPSPIEYDTIGIDVIRDSSMLLSLFSDQFHPTSKENFITHNNYTYPHSSKNLFGLCHHEQ